VIVGRQWEKYQVSRHAPAWRPRCERRIKLPLLLPPQMALDPEGAFGLIPIEKREVTRHTGVIGGRQRLRSAAGTIAPFELLGGLTTVSGLTENAVFQLPSVTAVAGLATRGGLRRGDRIEWVLQNTSTNAAGTATLTADALGTITMHGPLVASPGGYALHALIEMVTATTAMCNTEITGPAGIIGTGPNVLVYGNIRQETAVGSTSAQGVRKKTTDVVGGAIRPTAVELLAGCICYRVPAEPGGINPFSVILPSAADVAAALAAKGVTVAAGLRLAPLLIADVLVAPPSQIDWAAGAGVTFHGPGMVFDNVCASLHWVFSGPVTADVFAVRGL